MLYENISISKHYLHINNQQGCITLGGNQGWWKQSNDVLADYGCGVIAMCDMECYLYRRNSKKEMTREAYVEYVNQRYQEAYHFSELPVVKCLGLVPSVMCNGMNQFCKDNALPFHNAKWAKSKKVDNTIRTIYGMLEHKLPVVAAYDCTLSGDALPFYQYDSSKDAMKELGKIKSHYFIIVGIWCDQGNKNLFNIEDIIIWLQEQRNKTNNNRDNQQGNKQYYLEIATYGMRCFVPLDMWIKQLGMFTNVISLEY